MSHPTEENRPDPIPAPVNLAPKAASKPKPKSKPRPGRGRVAMGAVDAPVRAASNASASPVADARLDEANVNTRAMI